VSASTAAAICNKIWDDPERLRAWTIEQLYATDLDEVPWIFGVDCPDRHSPHQQHLNSREISAQIRDGLLRCKHEDPELYLRIVGRSEFLQWLMRKRRRGRPTGHVPGLAEAWEEVARIRKLWKRTFGRSLRKESPTAIEIAAERHSFEPRALNNYRKNKTRSR
jgi:hypothetical protein